MKLYTQALVALAFLLSVPLGSGAEPDYWPTDGWKTSTPEAQGMDSATLMGALSQIQERKLPVHSLLIVRNGYVVLEAYFGPFEPDWKHDIASCTKSFTSTLVGIAIDQGHIKGVGEPLLSFFPDRTPANPSADKDTITLEDVLTMRSGLTCQNSPTEVTLFQMMATPDWVQFTLDQPMEYAPGTEWVYNSTGSHLLSAIVHKTTGMRLDQFAEEYLFNPLGIKEAIWPSDAEGHNTAGWGSLRITPRDMAKLGFLYLNHGRWNGKQVVSEYWVRAATAQTVVFPDAGGSEGYGYQWWTFPYGYAAVGRGGQRIMVVPEKDLVVVFTAGGAKDTSKDLLTEHIIPAVKSDEALPASPLALDLTACRLPGRPFREQDRAKRLSRIARKVSGKTYRMGRNPLGLGSTTFHFESKNEVVFEFQVNSYDTERPGETVSLRIGLDGVPRLSPGRFGMPAAAVARWKGKSVLAVDYDELGNINAWKIQATFEDDKLELVMTSLTGLGRHRIQGRLID